MTDMDLTAPRPSNDVVRTHDKGHVRTIALNRPDKMNALSHALAWAIVTEVQKAAHDDDVWVIALTGTGRAFCAGLDLSGPGEDVSPLPPQERLMDDVSWVGRFALVLRHECDKPVVAGLNGVAAGAGLSLAMAADMRIAARSCRLVAGYPRIGASPDGGLTWTLPQAIGYEQAMRFLLENRTVDADEALALGFVGEVVDDDRLEARLAEYCAFLAERAPISSRLTKRGVARATEIDLEGHLRYELANIRRAFATEDAKEARQAFFEKRTPTFRGR
jgi:enoyl-CoA hydratase/carnithine racemase